MKFYSALTLLLAASSATANLRGLPKHRKLQEASEDTEAMTNQYIVSFSNDVDNAEQKAIELIDNCGSNASIAFKFKRLLNGITLSGIDMKTLNMILEDEQVVRVQEDFFYNIKSHETAVETTQALEPTDWGLDRIDQTFLPLDGNYTYQYTGKGVQVYIMDNGILPTHVEFQGRAVCAFNPWDDLDCVDGTPQHGTPIAGIIGGETVGVAKDVELFGIKYLNDENRGSASTLYASLEYIKEQKENNPTTPMVVNMSFSGIYVSEIEAAIESLIDDGIVVVTGSGNGGSATAACENLPSGMDKVITVGATNSSDYLSFFSNFDGCVDLYAPGSAITSTSSKADDRLRYNRHYGTSYAAPFVSGAAALYLEKYPDATPAQVKEALKAGASRSVIENFPIDSKQNPTLFLSTKDFVSPDPKLGWAPTVAPTTAPTLVPTSATPTNPPTFEGLCSATDVCKGSFGFRDGFRIHRTFAGRCIDVCSTFRTTAKLASTWECGPCDE